MCKLLRVKTFPVGKKKKKKVELERGPSHQGLGSQEPGQRTAARDQHFPTPYFCACFPVPAPALVVSCTILWGGLGFLNLNINAEEKEAVGLLFGLLSFSKVKGTSFPEYMNTFEIISMEQASKIDWNSWLT